MDHDVRIYNVKVANDLARRYAGMRLTVTQMKFICYLAARVCTMQFFDTEVPIHEFKRAMNITVPTRQVIEELNDLVSEEFKVLNIDRTFHWLSKLEFRNNRTIVARLHNSMWSLLMVEKSYYKFPLGMICNLRRTYTIQLYHFLHSWLDIHKVKASTGQLKMLLGFEYKAIVDIERRVLEPACEEINRCTDLYVTYERNENKEFYSKRTKCDGYIFNICQKSVSDVAKALKAAGVDDREVNAFLDYRKATKNKKESKGVEELATPQ